MTPNSPMVMVTLSPSLPPPVPPSLLPPQPTTSPRADTADTAATILVRNFLRNLSISPS
jgi:hypothetical protein